MKSMKKLVLAGLVLLASVVVFMGCDTPLEPESTTANEQAGGSENDSVPEVPKYTVTFDKNAEDATGEMTPQTFTQGEKKELTANAFVRPTWTFSGWSENKDATTPEYKDKAEFTTSKDTTLYAVWTDNGTVSPVTFDPSSTKLYYGETVTVTLSTTTEGARIHYQLGEEEWEIYEKPFTVSSETVVTAYATKDGLKDSEKTKSNYLRQLISITVIPPTRTVYSVGEPFDSTGMIVTATYEDGNTREATGWTTNFDEVTSEKGVNKTVAVSYTEGDNAVTATFTVDVVDPSVPTILTSYISPNHTDDTWTYVAFGEWPQTIKDKDVIVDETKSRQMGMFTYYLGNDGNHYVQVTADPYEDGHKYSDESVVEEGVEVYFKVEPIIWRVLTEDYKVPGEGGELQSTHNALLLAENILTGGIPYYDVDESTRTIRGAGTKDGEQDTVYPNNYKYSTIRAWLNGLVVVKSDNVNENDSTYNSKGFLQTAFTPEAQGLITSTTVDNSNESTFGSGEEQKDNPYACRNTSDKIFLLSEQEATMSDYGFGVYNASDNTRIRVTTDYAKATGAYQDSTADYCGWWWLRSPFYDYEYSARYIYLGGDAYYSHFIAEIEVGVVPALSISLQ